MGWASWLRKIRFEILLANRWPFSRTNSGLIRQLFLAILLA